MDDTTHQRGSLGKVWLSYNSPDYLKERHGLPQDLLQNIAGVEKLAAKAGDYSRQAP